MLKEKNRVTKEEISKNDKRQQNGVAMIEKAKDKMRGEGEINELTLALADKITAFHKVHTQANDKLSELRSEYISLQDDYSDLQDEYIALSKCLIPYRA